MDGWVTYKTQRVETIIAAATGSSPNELQFGRTYCMTPGVFNAFTDAKEYSEMSQDWEKYASKYQQGYTKYASVTCHFSSMDNRVFSENPQVTTSTLNPTSYIVGIIISRVPYFTPQIQPEFDWATVKKLGNCVYKTYTAGVTRSCTVTAKIDIGKCLQQYDFVTRCFEVMPIDNILNDPNNTIMRVVPDETRLYAIPFVVPLVKSAAEGAAYTINYHTTIRKLIRFSRPISDFATIRTYVPTILGQKLYPPVGTKLGTAYRPMTLTVETGNTGLSPIDIVQNDRLDDLEGNDNVQDQDIADNEAAILSVDQSLNTHINQQFPNVH